MANKYLITGNRGFIGRNLIKYILKNDKNAKIFSTPKKLDLSISSKTNLFFKNKKKIDYIFHLADISGNKNWSKKNSFIQTLQNIKMHTNVISAWQSYLPKSKFIFVSSLWAYPIGEKKSSEKNYWKGLILNETRHYGYSKKIATILIESAKKNYNLKGTTLVLGTVYGPGDTSDHFIPSIIRRMEKNKKILEVFGSGNESRDFIFIDDQIKGIFSHRNINEEILNIGSGNLIKTKQIIDILKKIMKYKGKIIYRNLNNSKDDLERGMSINKAKKLSGWSLPRNKDRLEKNLNLTVEDMKKNG